jgi:tetratricopeptide (TPR) repeat protein
MASAPDYAALVANLWTRVQTNEESSLNRRQILDDCDALLVDSEFERNEFLVNKVKLIQHKAGKRTDLNAVSASFESQFKLDPTNLDLVICEAECLLHQDKPDDAATFLETTRSLDVTSPELLCLLSLCYRRKTTKDIPGSVALAKEAIKLDMNNGKAWASYAIALLALTGPENVVASKKAFSMALKLGQDRNGDVWLNCGTVNEVLLDFMEALRCYEQALAVTQDWVLARDHCIRIQERLKRVIGRAEALEKLRPKRKLGLAAKVTADNEFLVVDFASDAVDIAQLAVGLDRSAQVIVLGFPKPTRAYLRLEKTLIRVKDPVFSSLAMDGVVVRYLIVDPATAQIIGGAQPHDVPGVQLTSSIA